MIADIIISFSKHICNRRISTIFYYEDIVYIKYRSEPHHSMKQNSIIEIWSCQHKENSCLCNNNFDSNVACGSQAYTTLDQRLNNAVPSKQKLLSFVLKILFPSNKFYDKIIR